jgi:hypothetical protein
MTFGKFLNFVGNGTVNFLGQITYIVAEGAHVYRFVFDVIGSSYISLIPVRLGEISELLISRSLNCRDL